MLAQTSELAETPIASVPQLGGELLTELDAARQLVAALAALEQAKTSGDADQVRALRQRLDQAREEYRELVSRHVHAPIGP